MKRLASSQDIEATYTEKVIDLIASRCTEVDTGARNIDHILRAALIPILSSAILAKMADGEELEKLEVDVADNTFVPIFSSAAE